MDKKIIYVLGCGRSGSTILGFCLGNAANTLDLGEVIEFTRFRGRPNGFDQSTENYAFWDRVLQLIETRDGEINFDRIKRLQNRFDKHYAIPLLFLPTLWLKPFGLAEYRKFLQSKYDGIFEQSQCQWFIDSSKYPSRLLHLRAIYGAETIKVAYLIRDPGILAKAFQNSEQSTTKSFLTGMLYYFGVNFASFVLFTLTPANNRIRIVYEKLVQFPKTSIETIGSRFGLDVSELLNKIENGLALKRGYIFNGNRMRIQKSIVFKQGSPRSATLPWHQGAITRLLKTVFMC